MDRPVAQKSEERRGQNGRGAQNQFGPHRASAAYAIAWLVSNRSTTLAIATMPMIAVTIVS